MDVCWLCRGFRCPDGDREPDSHARRPGRCTAGRRGAGGSFFRPLLPSAGWRRVDKPMVVLGTGTLALAPRHHCPTCPPLIRYLAQPAYCVALCGWPVPASIAATWPARVVGPSRPRSGSPASQPASQSQPARAECRARRSRKGEGGGDLRQTQAGCARRERQDRWRRAAISTTCVRVWVWACVDVRATTHPSRSTPSSPASPSRPLRPRPPPPSLPPSPLPAGGLKAPSPTRDHATRLLQDRPIPAGAHDTPKRRRRWDLGAATGKAAQRCLQAGRGGTPC